MVAALCTMQDEVVNLTASRWQTYVSSWEPLRFCSGSTTPGHAQLVASGPHRTCTLLLWNRDFCNSASGAQVVNGPCGPCVQYWRVLVSSSYPALLMLIRLQHRNQTRESSKSICCKWIRSIATKPCHPRSIPCSQSGNSCRFGQLFGHSSISVRSRCGQLLRSWPCLPSFRPSGAPDGAPGRSDKRAVRNLQVEV